MAPKVEARSQRVGAKRMKTPNKHCNSNFSYLHVKAILARQQIKDLSE